MARCNFDVGDMVKNHGVCGVIVEKTRVGNGYILTVSVDGTEFNWECSHVEACGDD